MLLDQIAYNILNLARGGDSSDDDRLTLRQIKFWIKSYRAKNISVFTDYGKDIDPQLIQDMGCVTLTEVDKAQSSTAKWGCNIGTATLPSIVDLPKNRGLVFVGLMDKQTPIEIVTGSTIAYLRDSRITGNIPRAYIIGNTLYVDTPSTNILKYINVRGVFDDPNEIQTCTLAGVCTYLRDDQDDYPIPARMIPLITQEILQKELNITLQVKGDEIGNTRDDT